MKKKITVLFALVLSLIPTIKATAQNSILSKGDWYKFGFVKKDIYKISGADLAALNIDLSTIDPSKIKVFGNGGGGMLPQENSAERPIDLIENPIYVVGDNDSAFDPNDFILFFGNSPHEITYNSLSRSFDVNQNLYSDSTFIFLTFSGETNGKRITQKAEVSNPQVTFFDFDRFSIIAEDISNLLNQGRKWYGDRFGPFSEPSRKYTFNIENTVGDWRLKASMMAGSIKLSSFNFKINGSSIGELEVPRILDETYVSKGKEVEDVFDIDATLQSNGPVELTVDYNYSDGGSKGYMDYLSLNYVSSLQYRDKSLFFRNTNSLDYQRVAYSIISNAGSNFVWDVTLAVEPSILKLNQVTDLYQFNDNSEKLREYVFFSLNQDFPSPSYVGKVGNQNLHTIEKVDAVIISHPLFLQEAIRLRDYHRTADQMAVEVVSIGEVYNEFSGGAQDVTAIRDFMKHLYNKDSGLKYLLLFGDCSYDYKDRISRKTNFVPVYQARESLHPISSYSSEDYFGFLEDDEGEWREGVNAINHSLDIGIGRLPVNTIEEARNAVDKILFYKDQEKTKGDWRNSIYFFADDGDGNQHQFDADRLSTLIDTTYIPAEVKKIYLDTYEQEPDPGGERSPDASRAVMESFDKGGLIINYSGHGNEITLADEQIFLNADIPSITNKKRLPLMVTATCQFGRYDDPFLVSGAEKLMNSSSGGAIALLTTTRPVFAHTNFRINEAFYKEVFKKEDGAFRRLGDILKDTKNNSLAGVNNRNFTLLGDPMLRLNYPEEELGLAIDENDTIKALQVVRLKGTVLDLQGNKDTDFNGILKLTVYDKENVRSTFGTEGSEVFEFKERNSVLFRGEVSIDTGAYEISFVVPKNIKYNFGKGRLSMYAFDETRNIDAAGGINSFIVGGSSDFNADTDGPKLQLFLNEEKQNFKKEVGQNPLLIVHLSDENGINLTDNGLSQFLTATLDDAQEFIMNDFYSADINTYKSGKIFYPLSGLSEGEHKLVVKAWDTYNNSSTATVIFTVSGDGSLFLTDVKNYPNPFTEATSFSFIHDRIGEDLAVTLEVIDLHGSVIVEKEFEVVAADRVVNSIQWELMSGAGSHIMPGVYLYKLMVFSKKDGAKGQFFSRLIIGK